jgi:hypothetical protein
MAGYMVYTGIYLFTSMDMTPKKAFSNGRSTAARLPVEAGIKPGDPITVTVLAPGKVLVERGAELPEYGHFIGKRSRSGGNVTSDLVAKLLEESGL